MKSLATYLMTCLCMAFASSMQAQVREAWVARYTLSAVGTNRAVAMLLDKDGNIIVGAHGTSTSGDFDYVTLKYSPSGSKIWHTTLSTPGDDLVRSMAVDNDGSALLTGTSLSVKYGSNGVERWTAPYGGRGIAVDPSGDAYVTGFSDTSFSTVKLHREAGTNMWQRMENVTPGQPDVSQVIAVDSKSNVFVSGEVVCYWQPRIAYGNHQIVSYDANGTVQWQTTATGPSCYYSFVRVAALGLDGDGAVYLAAETTPEGTAVSRYSSSGVREWIAYGSYVFNGLRAMAVDLDGSVYLTGRDSNPNSGERLIATEKIDSSGSHTWVGTYVSPSSRSGNAITTDSASNVYVTGQVPGANTGNDYATIKYSPAGQELWVQRYDGPAHGDDVATAIAVAPDGSVYVTGWSTTSSNLVEITTIKYTQSASLTVETNRNVNLQFPGTPGATNRVQATIDFQDWLDLGFTVADTNGLIHFIDTNAPSYPFRFYRTVTP